MGINALQILLLTTSKNRTVKPFSAAQCGFLFGGASGTRTLDRSVMSFRTYNNYTFLTGAQKGRKQGVFNIYGAFRVKIGKKSNAYKSALYAMEADSVTL